MRFLKVLTLILAACLLCGSMIACEKEGDGGETTTETSNESVAETVGDMTIEIIVRADSEEKFKGTVKFTGLLGDAIESFTLLNSDYEGDCFDATGILKTVCGITAGEGQSWVAYDDDLGKDKGLIPSIRTCGPKTDKANGLYENCTIVLVLE